MQVVGARLGLQRGGLAMAGGLAIAGKARSSHGSLNMDEPKNMLNSIVKVQGAIDGSLSASWLTGQRYAVIDARATPLFNFVSVVLSTHKRIDD